MNMRKTKKMWLVAMVVLACSVFLFCVSSCATPVSNKLMSNASPGTSALTLYRFDGKTTQWKTIYNGKTITSVLNELDSVSAKQSENWSLQDIELPVYGLWIGANDGFSIYVAWSNGYWISQDGTVYSFDYDFEKLEKDFPWTDEEEYNSFTLFPNARILSQDENGWNKRMLTPAEELRKPEGISLTLEAWGENTVDVQWINTGANEWMFGEPFSLQVLLEGEWYEIPTISGDWAFTAIGIILKSEEVLSKTYNLMSYGDLPSGTYRLVTEGLAVEAVIP